MKIKSNDPRIKILLRLLEEDKGTGEFKANKFLHSLQSDLGSIRRSLIDLIENDLIAISSNRSKVETIKIIKNKLNSVSPRDPNAHNIAKGSAVATKEEIEQYKLSKRLVAKIEHAPKIDLIIRIYITINGIKFLKDWENIENSNWLNRNRKRTFFLVLGMSLLSLIFSLISLSL